VNRSSLSGRYDSSASKISRLRSSRDRRLAMVRGSAEFWVCAGSLHMFSLRGYRRDMSFVGSSLFLRSRTLVYTAVAAIEANTGYGSVVYSCLVNVMNLGDVDVGHRTIVKKVVVVPTSTFEAMTKVTKAIVDPAVETYLRTPITIIENVSAVSPTPIARGPKKTNFRS
jgi:hypothetical protein